MKNIDSSATEIDIQLVLDNIAKEAAVPEFWEHCGYNLGLITEDHISYALSILQSSKSNEVLKNILYFVALKPEFGRGHFSQILPYLKEEDDKLREASNFALIKIGIFCDTDLIAAIEFVAQAHRSSLNVVFVMLSMYDGNEFDYMATIWKLLLQLPEYRHLEEDNFVDFSQIQRIFSERLNLADFRENFLIGLLLIGEKRYGTSNCSIFWGSADPRLRMLGSQMCISNDEIKAEFCFLLNDPIVFVRRAALQSIGRSSSSQLSALPSWHARFFDPSEEVRVDAIRAADTNPQALVPIQVYIAAILFERDSDLRSVLGYSLESIKLPFPDSMALDTILYALIASPDLVISKSGMVLTKKIIKSGSHRTLVQQCLFLSLLSDSEPAITWALSELGEGGYSCKEFLPFLIRFLESDNSEITSIAARAAGRAGFFEEEVIDLLEKLLDNDDHLTRVVASESLLLLGAKNFRAVEILNEFLRQAGPRSNIAIRIRLLPGFE